MEVSSNGNVKLVLEEVWRCIDGGGGGEANWEGEGFCGEVVRGGVVVGVACGVGEEVVASCGLPRWVRSDRLLERKV